MSRNKARLANDAWQALMTVHADMTRAFAADDTWNDVSMREYDVLYALARHKEPMSVSELNALVLLSQPALSRLVDRLAERGLITKTRDDGDGRAVRLALTDAGADTQRRTGAKHARCVRKALDRLDTAELEALEATCHKLMGVSHD